MNSEFHIIHQNSAKLVAHYPDQYPALYSRALCMKEPVQDRFNLTWHPLRSMLSGGGDTGEDLCVIKRANAGIILSVHE
jgi:hypothetical protein